MKILNLSLLSALCILLASCGSTKNIPYLVDAEQLPEKQLKETAMIYEAKIMPKDILTVTVNTTVPEAAVPFNLPLVGKYRIHQYHPAHFRRRVAELYCRQCREHRISGFGNSSCGWADSRTGAKSYQKQDLSAVSKGRACYQRAFPELQNIRSG